MPTNLPARTVTRTRRADASESGQALFLFYFAFALLAVVLVAAETQLGMFNGLTTAEAVLKATAPDLLVEETGAPWIPVSP